jgi:hypothetical protein
MEEEQLVEVCDDEGVARPAKVGGEQYTVTLRRSLREFFVAQGATAAVTTPRGRSVDAAMREIEESALEWSGEVTFRQLLSWIRTLRGGSRVPDEMLRAAQSLFQKHDRDESEGLNRAELLTLLVEMETDPIFASVVAVIPEGVPGSGSGGSDSDDYSSSEEDDSDDALSTDEEEEEEEDDDDEQADEQQTAAVEAVIPSDKDGGSAAESDDDDDDEMDGVLLRMPPPLPAAPLAAAAADAALRSGTGERKVTMALVALASTKLLAGARRAQARLVEDLEPEPEPEPAADEEEEDEEEEQDEDEEEQDEDEERRYVGNVVEAREAMSFISELRAKETRERMRVRDQAEAEEEAARLAAAAAEEAEVRSQNTRVAVFAMPFSCERNPMICQDMLGGSMQEKLTVGRVSKQKEAEVRQREREVKQRAF